MFASPADQSARASMARLFGGSGSGAAMATATPHIKEVVETTTASFDLNHAWARVTENFDVKWFKPFEQDDWMTRAHKTMSHYMPSNIHTMYEKMQAFMSSHWRVIIAVAFVIVFLSLFLTFKIAKRIIAYIRARRANSLRLVSGPALAAGTAIMAGAAAASSSSYPQSQMPSMWSRFRAYIGDATQRMAMQSFMARVKIAIMNAVAKCTAFMSRWMPSWVVMIGVQLVMFWLRLVIALSNLWYRCKCFLTRGKDKTIHVPSACNASEMRAHMAHYDSTARSIMQADMLSHQKMDELRASIASIFFNASSQLKQDGKTEVASILEQSCQELLRSGSAPVS